MRIYKIFFYLWFFLNLKSTPLPFNSNVCEDGAPREPEHRSRHNCRKARLQICAPTPAAPPPSKRPVKYMGELIDKFIFSNFPG